MAKSIIDMFESNKKEYEVQKGKDKTPHSDDKNEIPASDTKKVDTARGGSVASSKPYSSTVKY